MNKFKHIIIPGLAKAGTTFLHYNFKKLDQFSVTKNKEVDYFRKKQKYQYEEYLELFEDKESATYFVDANPQYFTGHPQIFSNIKKTLPDTYFIVCLRNPIKRAYSHYLHDLIDRISNLELFYKPVMWEKDSVHHQFSDYKSLHKYFVNFSGYLDHIVKLFGKDKLTYFLMEYDIRDISEFNTRLSRLLDDTIEMSEVDPSKKYNEGGWIPYFLYNHEREIQYVVNERVYYIPRKTLVLINNKKSKIWSDFPEERGYRITGQANAWSNEVSQEFIDLIYGNSLKKDLQKICAFFDIDIGLLDKDREISARKPTLPESLLKKFEFDEIKTYLDTSKLKGGNLLNYFKPDFNEVDSSLLSAYSKIKTNSRFSSFEIDYHLANKSLEENDFKGAEKRLLDSIDRNPMVPDLYYLLSQVYLKKRSLDNAFRYAEKAFNLNKSYAKVTYNLALICIELKLKDKAIYLFDRLIKNENSDFFTKEKAKAIRKL